MDIAALQERLNSLVHLHFIDGEEVEAWKQRDNWDNAPMMRRMEDDCYIRWATLIHQMLSPVSA